MTFHFALTHVVGAIKNNRRLFVKQRFDCLKFVEFETLILVSGNKMFGDVLIRQQIR